ncbi:MAG: RNA polymerase sigma factor [Candidatus Saccharicenans sp.]|nr:MAG: hypothetical protein C0168_06800 [Candidatus Aminicenantes bacterium]HEK84960.1 sigma-70 family RNA polymerase sigma factor [Candidatus Aminicenantes bacterium]
MEMGEESQLVLRARDGDVEAFMMLARKYEQAIFRLIYRLTKNKEDAADLTQETFLRAFKGIKEFRLKSNFHTWLHRIAVNVSLNYLKKYRTQNSSTEYIDGLGNKQIESLADPSPEEKSISEELQISLEKAIEKLPLTYQTTFTLVVFQGMSHREAAKVLGCSENTVSWRMHEIRKILKGALQPYLNTGLEG